MTRKIVKRSTFFGARTTPIIEADTLPMWENAHILCILIFSPKYFAAMNRVRVSRLWETDQLMPAEKRFQSEERSIYGGGYKVTQPRRSGRQ